MFVLEKKYNCDLDIHGHINREKSNIAEVYYAHL